MSDTAGCAVCENAAAQGWTGQGGSHCRACHKSWLGAEEAHCCRCHQHFPTAAAFDEHQRGGTCRTEAES